MPGARRRTRRPRRSTHSESSLSAETGRGALSKIDRLARTDRRGGRRPDAGDARGSARPSRLGALVAASRPRQWMKNLLVFGAPASAGQLTTAYGFVHTLYALGVFTAASAGTYLMNDVVDAASDRAHPVKRNRPVASGALRKPTALFAAAVLVAGAASGAALVSSALLGVVGAYVVLSLAYSLFLKQVPVVELACVAAGFVLRAVAGGLATHAYISPWFLIVTSSVALLIVAGKRSAERASLASERGAHRPVLEEYTPTFLRSTRLIAAAASVTSYCLWVSERAHDVARAPHFVVYFELSVLPFVLLVLSLELALDKGRGGEPEALALTDRRLQVLGLAWVALFAFGVYG